MNSLDVRYSVPAEALGRFVAVCRPVGCARFEVRRAGRFVAAHTVVSGRI